MNRILLYLGIILAILLVGLWGYYLYSQYYQKAAPPKTTLQTPKPVAQSPKTQPAQTNQSAQTISFNDELSLLNFLDITPTEEQRVKFFEALNRFAKEGNSITISNCRATAIALKVKTGQEFKIINNDNVDYILPRIGNKQYPLPAKQTITLKANFGAGAHGYRCEGKGFENQPVAGYFYVVD